MIYLYTIVWVAGIFLLLKLAGWLITEWMSNIVMDAITPLKVPTIKLVPRDAEQDGEDIPPEAQAEAARLKKEILAELDRKQFYTKTRRKDRTKTCVVRSVEGNHRL